MKKKQTISKDNDQLMCCKCGNKDRFVEVMAAEAHLVNSRKDYIKLLEGIVDHYLCWSCGAKIKDIP